MESILYKIGYSSLKEFNCIGGTHIKIMCPSVLVRIFVFFNDYEILNIFRYLMKVFSLGIPTCFIELHTFTY